MSHLKNSNMEHVSKEIGNGLIAEAWFTIEQGDLITHPDDPIPMYQTDYEIHRVAINGIDVVLDLVEPVFNHIIKFTEDANQ